MGRDGRERILIAAILALIAVQAVVIIRNLLRIFG